MNKEYLGDGVYVEIIGRVLVLTTENGISVTNTIYLEGEVYSALDNYVKRLLARVAEQEPRHQTGCICADCSGAELTADND